MTVRRGGGYGEPATLPAEAPVAGSDAELRALVERARQAKRPLDVVGLTGGDLCRTLGGGRSEGQLRREPGTRVPVDLGAVLVDGRLHTFAAHLVVRGSWWRGPLTAAMNAAFIGTWNVAPRAHPNDGLLDLVEADLSIGDRLAARRRLASGTHVPHPGIVQKRTRAVQIDVPRGQRVHLDGVDIGRSERLSVRVEPDALHVVV